jgi:1-acyl-sn-glycerol-3-phosphate acyltransferase
MLHFSDQPYRYFPPKRLAPITWLIMLLNRWQHLPRAMQVHGVEVSGRDSLDVIGHDDRVVLTPNHPTHADSSIYVEALRQVGIRSDIMAAYDVFLRSRWDAWVMQKLGCFSVDREGSDAQAMKQAARTIRQGRFGLTLFPEGNVYLQNDLVTPFHDGAAMLALRAARQLAADSHRVLIVPVSIKVTYSSDVIPAVIRRLDQVATAVDAQEKGTAQGDTDMLDRLRRVGVAALRRNLCHRGLPIDADLDLSDLIEATAGDVLQRLERKIGIEARPDDSLIDRVRKARRAIHRVRSDPDRLADHESAAVWADEAMLAFRIASYRGDYVQSRPTVDRFAETVEKLAEDVFSAAQPPLGPRRAFVHFSAPIDTAEYLDSFRKKARVAVQDLSARLERTVQAGVDGLNAANPHPGGRPWAA